MDPEKIKYLHSRYNPQAEADRYISSLSLNETIQFFILIEPGLGYLVAPLKKKYPSARIIALHVEDFRCDAPSNEKLCRPDSEWRPGSGCSVQDFLENEIPDTQAETIKMLEWRPALAIYGNSYLSLIEETVSFIKRADANARTTKAFGRRWFKNFLKNTALTCKVLCPESFYVPMVITGAGPGLEDAIPLIRAFKSEASGRSKPFILAASSSLMCLKAEDLLPDMVISTDGGNWAALHLYECCRGSDPLTGNGLLPIAAPLTAALPSQCGTLPVLPISDGSLWQTLVLNRLGIPFITLPQRGTVSASALDLAFALTRGNIYIAGMDLANNDIRSHLRPYSFDRLLEEKAYRLNPVYSQTFKRSSLLKTGGSYSIYASWFEKQMKSYPKRLFSLGRNNPVFNSAGSVPPDPSAPRSDGASTLNFRVIAINQTGRAASDAAGILEKALMNPEPTQVSAKLHHELSDLLFPGKKDVAKKELIDAIHSFASRERS